MEIRAISKSTKPLTVLYYLTFSPVLHILIKW